MQFICSWQSIRGTTLSRGREGQREHGRNPLRGRHKVDRRTMWQKKRRRRGRCRRGWETSLVRWRLGGTDRQRFHSLCISTVQKVSQTPATRLQRAGCSGDSPLPVRARRLSQVPVISQTATNIRQAVGREATVRSRVAAVRGCCCSSVTTAPCAE